MAFAAEYGSRIAGRYTVVTNCSRVGHQGDGADHHPRVGPVGERLPPPLPVLGVRVRRLQRLQVDHVIGNAHPVIAEIVCGPGHFDDLTGVQERGADVELHALSRAHAGWMNTPSASTVGPSASAMKPFAYVLIPSTRSIQASARSRPQRCAAQIPARNRPGEQRLGQPCAGHLAEDVVEDQRAHAAVHVAGRALVGRAQARTRSSTADRRRGGSPTGALSRCVRR